jgi:putative ABC transport system substrate-binding protein
VVHTEGEAPLIDRRTFLAGTGAVFLAAPLAADAQQAGKVWRIGYLSPAPEHNPIDDVFDLAMRQRGYLEGQSLLVDRRYTGGRAELLRGFADELAGLNPDVIVAWSTAGALAAKRATNTIPIVFLSVLDPIRLDMVASFAHPGGQMTGTSYDAEVETYPKRLQLLKEAIPSLSRVTVLGSAENIAFAPWTEMEKAARSLHLALQRQDLHGSEELDGAISAARQKGANALLILSSGFAYTHRKQIADVAARYRLPTMNPFRENVAAGGLMSYAASNFEVARQGAAYVAKILRGAKPADLPVEQPTKFELVINLKTAKALGLTIPPSLLQRADELIQ